MSETVGSEIGIIITLLVGASRAYSPSSSSAHTSCSRTEFHSVIGHSLFSEALRLCQANVASSGLAEWISWQAERGSGTDDPSRIINWSGRR